MTNAKSNYNTVTTQFYSNSDELIISNAKTLDSAKCNLKDFRENYFNNFRDALYFSFVERIEIDKMEFINYLKSKVKKDAFAEVDSYKEMTKVISEMFNATKMIIKILEIDEQSNENKLFKVNDLRQSGTDTKQAKFNISFFALVNKLGFEDMRNSFKMTKDNREFLKPIKALLASTEELQKLKSLPSAERTKTVQEIEKEIKMNSYAVTYGLVLFLNNAIAVKNLAKNWIKSYSTSAKNDEIPFLKLKEFYDDFSTKINTKTDTKQKLKDTETALHESKIVANTIQQEKIETENKLSDAELKLAQAMARIAQLESLQGITQPTIQTNEIQFTYSPERAESFTAKTA